MVRTKLPRIRVRTLLAFVAAPTLVMVMVFAMTSWVRLGEFDKDARALESEGSVVTELASLRFDISMSVASRELQSRLPDFHAAQAKDAREYSGGNSADRYVGSLRVLREQAATVQRVAGTEAMNIIEVVERRYREWDSSASAATPSGSATEAERQADLANDIAEMTAISDDLDDVLRGIGSRLSPTVRSATGPILDVGYVQSVLADEATLVMSLISEGGNGAEHMRETILPELERTAAIQEVVLERLKTSLSPELFESLSNSLELDTNARLREAIAQYVDTGDLDRFLAYLASDIEGLTARYWEIGSVRDNVIRAIVGSVGAEQAQREAEYRGTALMMIALATVGVIIAAVVARSVSRRLSVLASCAEQISDGRLPDDPLELDGPLELNQLARAFNGMTAQMDVVDRKVAAIADGKFDEPILRAELPGPRGADLQRSVERVVTTTANLVAAEALTSAIVDSAADAIFTTDSLGGIRSANPASVELTSLNEGAVLGRRIGDLLDGLPDPASASRRGGSEQLVVERFDGERFHVLVSVRSLGSGPDDGFTVYVRDISERARWEEQFRRVATTDEVTGLANGLGLREFTAAGGVAVLGVIAVDLQRYRIVTDAWGRPGGDQVIRQVASRLTAALPPGSFVARTGRSEFIVIVAESEGSSIDRVAFNIVDEIGEPMRLGGGEIRLDASLGVADVHDSEGDEDIAELVRYAELALVKAREEKVQVLAYRSGIADDYAREATLEQRLRVAVETSALEMHAQPVVLLGSGRISGFELLARWRDEGEWIPPDVFIPIAEKAGLIPALERWAMGVAVDLLNRLHDAGVVMSVSFNLSGLHLMSGTVVDELAPLLVGTKWDPSQLHVEVTESVLVDEEAASRYLEDVHALGPKVWLDDFGTGYSSLGYLNHLPIDGIKLDRSFVTGSDSSERAAGLVRIVSEIARNFDLDLIAEGVETLAELEVVQSLGYSSGQGWLWHRAYPLAELWPLIEYERRAGLASAQIGRPVSGTAAG